MKTKNKLRDQTMSSLIYNDVHEIFICKIMFEIKYKKETLCHEYSQDKSTRCYMVL